MDDFINKIADRLRQPLPGAEAQYKLAHVSRHHAPTPPDDVRQAAVLALFYLKADDWHIVLIERESSNPNDRHGGQIGLPGGKYETSDASLQDTALREAEEEVGVDASRVEVLGALTELYIPVSNFQVNPYVGFTNYTPNFSPQIEEVRAILEVPFRVFQQPEALRSTDLRITPNITLRNVPYFAVQDKIVWGATAMMLSELIEALR